ncbi:MAG: TonB-dependent receptor [Verrucomicrobia bacterium]|nr:TonB-dependent receptor [Verrucomicrobiota bacterium]
MQTTIAIWLKNALSATKFNTPLRDIPISLQVLTTAFMTDTFSKDLESAMEFAAAVNDSIDSGGTRETGIFSIRGFRIDRVKRDGVVAYYGQDMTNVERVEVMKGPASLLYGQTEPGGIINYVPKRPFEEPRYGFKLSAGNHGFYRAEMEATGPLIKNESGFTRLLYRLDASYEEQDGWKASAAHRRKFISPVVEWRLFPRTSITFQYEHHDHRRVTQHGFARGSRFAREQWLAAEDTPSPNDLKTIGTVTGGQSGYMLLQADTGLPVLVSPDPSDPTRFRLSNLPGVVGDPRWDDGNGFLRASPDWFVFNPNTATTSTVVLVLDEVTPKPYDFVAEHPDDFNLMQRDFFSLDFQSALPWDSWFVRVVAVWDNPTLDIMESRHLPLATYSGQSVRYSRPNFSSTWFENKLDHYQINITGRWELAGITNQSLIGGELISNYFRNRVWAQLPPPEVDVAGELVRVINPSAIPFVPANRIFEINNSALRDRSTLLPSTNSLRNESQGVYVSNLASFWDDHMKLLTGIRYDRAKTTNYRGNGAGQPEMPAWTEVNTVSPIRTKTTPQVGLIYAPNQSLSFYASYSRSFGQPASYWTGQRKWHCYRTFGLG